MQKVVYFNYRPMGLGGLWQNISWNLKNNVTEFYLHLDEWNYNRFIAISNCFDKKITLHRLETLHYEDKIEQDWTLTVENIINDILLKYNYDRNEIQKLNCVLRHRYVTTKFNTKNREKYIALYLKYFDEDKENPRNELHQSGRDLTQSQSDTIIEYLEKLKISYKILGPNNTVEKNCQIIANASCCLGREGGWTHVSHSTRTNYYPIMNLHHPSLNYAHGIENKYCKDFTHYNDYERLINFIVCRYQLT